MCISQQSILRYQIGNIISKIQYKIRLDVDNNSQRILGIDLLKKDVKRSLLTLITMKLERNLIQLADSRTGYENAKLAITDKTRFYNLIKISTEEFLLSQYGIKVNVREKDIKDSLFVQSVLEDFDIIYRTSIETLVDKKSQTFRSLFSPIYNYASEDFIEALFDNLVLEISNCILYLITVDLSFLNELQKTIYKSKFLSLRNMERFKNNFTWQVKTKKALLRPLDIYNNRCRIYIIRTSGIYSRTLYANRSKEVSSLRDLPLWTISIVELRDFLASRLDETLYLVGNGVRFTLTSVCGQVIGLVWRGIIEGLKK